MPMCPPAVSLLLTAFTGDSERFDWGRVPECSEGLRLVSEEYAPEHWLRPLLEWFGPVAAGLFLGHRLPRTSQPFAGRRVPEPSGSAPAPDRPHPSSAPGRGSGTTDLDRAVESGSGAWPLASSPSHPRTRPRR